MRTIVVGDTHLHPGSETGTSHDFLRVVRDYLAHGPCDVILSGDVYDLAMAGSGPLALRLRQIVDSQPSFHQALAEVIAAGGEVQIIPGNHDYELLLDTGRSAFESLVPGARVRPWFSRVYGHTHVEHGNQYDPDNAHPHPLVPGDDPLGVMLTRQILARLGDLRMLGTNGKGPLAVLLRCFAYYGARTPALVARYLWLGLVRTFGNKPEPSAEVTAAAEAAFLRQCGDADPRHVEALRALQPRPTHLDGWQVFRRLYLDRLIGCVALVLGFTAAAIVKPMLLPWLGAAAGVIAFLTVLFARNRYAGRVESLLRDAAHGVADGTNARHVVLGHAHEAYDDGVYLNTGSFGFPAGDGHRVFVEVDRHGARHRFMVAGGELLPAHALQSLASERRGRAKSPLYAYAQKRLGRHRADARVSSNDRPRPPRRPTR